ncbi:LysR family transcriptional regulator [Variovorax sp. KK3]|uniref:LysR family transcriptional regulator n=1 Tax=Variovorax sp. KK3 TaxID=1855728 RepID=UPI00097C5961|nr:LysR family transcriptional regulator [Variovorax sp. KK3]
MRELNLDQLRTLVAIADLGTFSAAAQALHLAQPTVSLHVSELESRLGATLVLRGARRVTTTPAGAVLVERGRRLLRDADDAIEAVQRQHQGLAGRVRIGCSTTSVVVDLLPPVFHALLKHYPDIVLTPSFLGSEYSVSGVLAGALDLAIIALPQPATPGLALTPWRQHSMAAFIPASWEAPRRVTPAWLAQHPLIMNQPGSRMYALTMEWFAQAGFAPRARIEHDYDVAMRGLVAAGYGVALLPAPDEGKVADAGEHVQTRPLSPKLTRHLAIAYRANGPLDGATQRVIEMLLAFGRG